MGGYEILMDHLLFDKIYQKLATKRDDKLRNDDIKVSDRQQECVGEDTLP